MRGPTSGASNGSAVTLSYVFTVSSTNVNRAHPRRVALGAYPHGEVAERADDAQPVLPDCFKVCAAGDDRDVLSRPRQQRPVVPADSTGADERESHVC